MTQNVGILAIPPDASGLTKHLVPRLMRTALEGAYDTHCENCERRQRALACFLVMCSFLATVTDSDDIVDHLSEEAKAYIEQSREGLREIEASTNPTVGVVKMRNAVPPEQRVIQLKPKDGRSAAEAQAFLEGRLKEAERIDPQTCEYRWWYADSVDPYNIFEYGEVSGCFDKECFVYNVPDGDWVWYGDLPEHIFKALRERMEREADTYENYLRRPKESRQLWEDKQKLRRMLTNYSFFLSSDVDRAADAHKLRAYLREWQERHPDQLHPRTGDQTIVALFRLVNTMLDIIQPDKRRPNTLSREALRRSAGVSVSAKSAALPNESNR
jgi:hypothetical protein